MINNLFTYPISRSNFFVGKLIVMFLIISVTLFSSFVLSLLSGVILKHEPLTTVYLKAYMLMVIMHFALVPIVGQLSISKRNIIPPIIGYFCNRYCIELKIIEKRCSLKIESGITIRWIIPSSRYKHYFEGDIQHIMHGFKKIQALYPELPSFYTYEGTFMPRAVIGGEC